ncbi:LPS export ABC transporter periplasmic protein LptC [Amantichitinum ursilacus]|uniref:Lipopolysaccharide-assembly, LptC-related protein n=1 Tax=Amantichitinum ursilacus TaxID=857265 RepID=A0A0N1JTA9_9NEIS|nr:LPS export ABC transporter periplasmic protein LptC [Amantichitinum ursilacus]KPC54047.1 Lipopolysaccharide-assembly, LptC-related protein [Amantichitinum ursilacus]
MSQRLLPLVMIVMLGLLVWLLNSAASLPALEHLNRNNEPDLIVQKTHSVRFNEAGQPFERLDADRVRHITENDVAWFDNPHFTYVLPGKPRMDLVTSSAQSINKGDKLWMPDTAVLTRQPDEQHTKLVITGRQVWFAPTPGLVWSDAEVVADMGGSRASGVGFSADTQKQTIILKSKVSTIYDPPKRTR